MKFKSIFIVVLLTFFVFVDQVDAREREKTKREWTHASPLEQIEGSVDTDNPDSLWYGFSKDSWFGQRKGIQRELDHFPKYVPDGPFVVPEDYNRDAYPHLKNLAVFCNQQWKNQECLKKISALSVEMTKDYMKKIYQSKKVPQDLKVPSHNVLKSSCAGTVIKEKQEIIPVVMRDNLVKCLNAVTTINGDIDVKPDRDLRQLVVSSVFCVGHEPQCNMIEGQLELIAKPRKESISGAQELPAEENKPESE